MARKEELRGRGEPNLSELALMNWLRMEGGSWYPAKGAWGDVAKKIETWNPVERSNRVLDVLLAWRRVEENRVGVGKGVGIGPGNEPPGVGCQRERPPAGRVVLELLAHLHPLLPLFLQTSESTQDMDRRPCLPCRSLPVLVL